MEIWKKSRLIESTNRQIALQPQSRTHTVEIPYQKKATLLPVELGEIVVTVLKGNGIIKTKEGNNTIESGDQVYLVEGDQFALSSANPDVSFVVQMYWSPDVIEL